MAFVSKYDSIMHAPHWLVIAPGTFLFGLNRKLIILQSKDKANTHVQTATFVTITNKLTDRKSETSDRA